MAENLLPGIELVNGDCAAVLPGLPTTDLILTSPPYDHLREYGGYTALLTLTLSPRLALPTLRRAACWSGWLTTRSLTAAKLERVSGRRWALWVGVEVASAVDFFQAERRRGSQKRLLSLPRVYVRFAKGAPREANLLKDKASVQSGRRHHLRGGGFGATGDKDRNQPRILRFNPAAAGAIRAAGVGLGLHYPAIATAIPPCPSTPPHPPSPSAPLAAPSVWSN